MSNPWEMQGTNQNLGTGQVQMFDPTKFTGTPAAGPQGEGYPNDNAAAADEGNGFDDSAWDWGNEDQQQTGDIDNSYQGADQKSYQANDPNNYQLHYPNDPNSYQASDPNSWNQDLNAQQQHGWNNGHDWQNVNQNQCGQQQGQGQVDPNVNNSGNPGYAPFTHVDQDSFNQDTGQNLDGSQQANYYQGSFNNQEAYSHGAFDHGAEDEDSGTVSTMFGGGDDDVVCDNLGAHTGGYSNVPSGAQEGVGAGMNPMQDVALDDEQGVHRQDSIPFGMSGLQGDNHANSPFANAPHTASPFDSIGQNSQPGSAYGDSESGQNLSHSRRSSQGNVNFMVGSGPPSAAHSRQNSMGQPQMFGGQQNQPDVLGNTAPPASGQQHQNSGVPLYNPAAIVQTDQQHNSSAVPFYNPANVVTSSQATSPEMTPISPEARSTGSTEDSVSSSHTGQFPFFGHDRQERPLSVASNRSTEGSIKSSSSHRGHVHPLQGDFRNSPQHVITPPHVMSPVAGSMSSRASSRGTSPTMQEFQHTPTKHEPSKLAQDNPYRSRSSPRFGGKTQPMQPGQGLGSLTESDNETENKNIQSNMAGVFTPNAGQGNLQLEHSTPFDTSSSQPPVMDSFTGGQDQWWQKPQAGGQDPPPPHQDPLQQSYGCDGTFGRQMSTGSEDHSQQDHAGQQQWPLQDNPQSAQQVFTPPQNETHQQLNNSQNAQELFSPQVEGHSQVNAPQMFGQNSSNEPTASQMFDQQREPKQESQTAQRMFDPNSLPGQPTSQQSTQQYFNPGPQQSTQQYFNPGPQQSTQQSTQQYFNPGPQPAQASQPTAQQLFNPTVKQGDPQQGQQQNFNPSMHSDQTTQQYFSSDSQKELEEVPVAQQTFNQAGQQAQQPQMVSPQQQQEPVRQVPHTSPDQLQQTSFNPHHQPTDSRQHQPSEQQTFTPQQQQQQHDARHQGPQPSLNQSHQSPPAAYSNTPRSFPQSLEHHQDKLTTQSPSLTSPLTSHPNSPFRPVRSRTKSGSSDVSTASADMSGVKGQMYHTGGAAYQEGQQQQYRKGSRESMHGEDRIPKDTGLVDPLRRQHHGQREGTMSPATTLWENPEPPAAVTLAPAAPPTPKRTSHPEVSAGQFVPYSQPSTALAPSAPLPVSNDLMKPPVVGMNPVPNMPPLNTQPNDKASLFQPPTSRSMQQPNEPVGQGYQQEPTNQGCQPPQVSQSQPPNPYQGGPSQPLNHGRQLPPNQGTQSVQQPPNQQGYQPHMMPPQAKDVQQQQGSQAPTSQSSYLSPGQAGMPPMFSQAAMSSVISQPDMPPASSPPGMTPASSQPGMPSASSQPGMPPASTQPGMPSASTQPMPPVSSQPSMPPASSPPGMPASHPNIQTAVQHHSLPRLDQQNPYQQGQIQSAGKQDYQRPNENYQQNPPQSVTQNEPQRYPQANVQQSEPQRYSQNVSSQPGSQYPPNSQPGPQYQQTTSQNAPSQSQYGPPNQPDPRSQVPARQERTPEQSQYGQPNQLDPRSQAAVRFEETPHRSQPAQPNFDTTNMPTPIKDETGMNPVTNVPSTPLSAAVGYDQARPSPATSTPASKDRPAPSQDLTPDNPVPDPYSDRTRDRLQYADDPRYRDDPRYKDDPRYQTPKDRGDPQRRVDPNYSDPRDNRLYRDPKELDYNRPPSRTQSFRDVDPYGTGRDLQRDQYGYYERPRSRQGSEDGMDAQASEKTREERPVSRQVRERDEYSDYYRRDYEKKYSIDYGYDYRDYNRSRSYYDDPYYEDYYRRVERYNRGYYDEMRYYSQQPATQDETQRYYDYYRRASQTGYEQYDRQSQHSRGATPGPEDQYDRYSRSQTSRPSSRQGYPGSRPSSRQDIYAPRENLYHPEPRRELPPFQPYRELPSPYYGSQSSSQQGSRPGSRTSLTSYDYEDFMRTYNQYGSRPGSRQSYGQEYAQEYNQAYNQSYQDPGAWPDQAAVAGTDEHKGRMTPAKFAIPHVVARFGPCGQLIKVLPNRPADGQPACVEVHEVENMYDSQYSDADILKSFPGPLIKGETHKNDVLAFCHMKARHCHENIAMLDRESAELIWKYMELLIKQNGTVLGCDISDLLLEGHEPTSQEYHRTGIPIPEQSMLQQADITEPTGTVVADRSIVSKVSTVASVDEITDRFRHLLLYGRKKDALEWASKHHLWGHALFLASKMDNRTHANIMTRFANNSMKMNDPLQTLYQLMSGRQPAAVTCISDNRWGDWRPHISMVLSNTSNKPDLDRKSIAQLGDTLAARGCLHASHFCYLMAQQPFGTYHKKTSKIVLVGSSHNLPLEDFATNEAIQCTEVYEYAQALGNPLFSLPNFQTYKYLYATRLAESGLSQEALMYVEIISQSIVRSPGRFNPVLVRLVYDLGNRLKYSDPQRFQSADDSEDPYWLIQLQKVCQGFDEGTIQPISGSATPAFGSTTTESEQGDGAAYGQDGNMTQYGGQDPNQLGGYTNYDQTGPQQTTEGQQQQYQGFYQGQDGANQDPNQPYQQQQQQWAVDEFGNYYDPNAYAQQQDGHQWSDIQQCATDQTDGDRTDSQLGQDVDLKASMNSQYSAMTNTSGESEDRLGESSSTFDYYGASTQQFSSSAPNKQMQAARPQEVERIRRDSARSTRSRTSSGSTMGGVETFGGSMNRNAEVQIQEVWSPLQRPRRSSGHSRSRTNSTGQPSPPYSAENSPYSTMPGNALYNPGSVGQLSPQFTFGRTQFFPQSPAGQNSQPSSPTRKNFGDFPAGSGAQPGIEDKTPSPAAPSKPTETKEQKPQKSGGGIFGSIFNKLPSFRGKNQMILPDEKNPAITWDPVNKRWSSKDGGEEDAAPAAPPPKDSDLKPTIPAFGVSGGPPTGNRFSRQKSRGARGQYVDIMNPSQSAATPVVPPNLFNVMPSASSTAMPANIFMPPPVPTEGVDSGNQTPAQPQVANPTSEPTTPTEEPALSMGTNLMPPQSKELSRSSSASSLAQEVQKITQGQQNQAAAPAAQAPAPQGGAPQPAGPPAAGGLPAMFNPAQFSQQQQPAYGAGPGRAGPRYGQRRAYPK